MKTNKQTNMFTDSLKIVLYLPVSISQYFFYTFTYLDISKCLEIRGFSKLGGGFFFFFETCQPFTKVKFMEELIEKKKNLREMSRRRTTKGYSDYWNERLFIFIETESRMAKSGWLV